MNLPERESPTKARFAAALETLVAQAGDDARALAGLAAAAQEHGLGMRAAEIAKTARNIAPDDPQVRALTGRPLGAGVPRWHHNILRDLARNASYRAALEQVVRPGDRVLDIGAGSGLLSMIAARAGAAQVTACEVNTAVADAAVRTVAHNGFADRITIVPRYSTDVDVDRDLGGRVDVIVQEIIAHDMLCEGVLPALADAVPRFLKPGGRVVPERAQLRVALAHWPHAKARELDDVEGFDLAPFGTLARYPLEAASNDPTIALRSEAVDLFSWNLASGGPYGPGRTDTMLTVRDGEANGVIQWIHIDLIDGVTYENAPAPGPNSSWACLFYPFACGPVAAGTTMRVHGAHSMIAMRIWAEPETPAQ